MTILEQLKQHHKETLVCAVTLHGLMESNKSSYVSRKALLNKLSQSEKGLSEEMKLAAFANTHGLLENDSLKLAQALCAQMGITEEEFALASEYKMKERCIASA